jgi:BirA family biotin operon repressor/biotin-[acetyl-CoA-carboxylase] ligase
MVSALPADFRAAIDAARDRLRGFDRVEHFAEVQSTNDLALARAAAGAPAGTVIIADAQNAGRGRLGRVWHSPPDAWPDICRPYFAPNHGRRHFRW